MNMPGLIPRISLLTAQLGFVRFARKAIAQYPETGYSLAMQQDVGQKGFHRSIQLRSGNSYESYFQEYRHEGWECVENLNITM